MSNEQHSARPTETRAVCDGCGQEIDPDCCGCGDSSEFHASIYNEANHPFIPMGCDCFREPREPDGECYRGSEYSSALAEEQAWIQRNLK